VVRHAVDAVDQKEEKRLKPEYAQSMEHSKKMRASASHIRESKCHLFSLGGWSYNLRSMHGFENQ
jgi:hypothetical protein